MACRFAPERPGSRSRSEGCRIFCHQDPSIRHCQIKRFLAPSTYLRGEAGLNKFKWLANRSGASKQPFLVKCDNAALQDRNERLSSRLRSRPRRRAHCRGGRCRRRGVLRLTGALTRCPSCCLLISGPIASLARPIGQGGDESMSRYSSVCGALFGATAFIASAGGAHATGVVPTASSQAGAYGASAVTADGCDLLQEDGGTGFTSAMASSSFTAKTVRSRCRRRPISRQAS